MIGTILYCRSCRSRVGMVPIGNVLWTGSVDRMPGELDGFIYAQCRRCKKWQRFEVAPPEPLIELPELAADITLTA